MKTINLNHSRIEFIDKCTHRQTVLNVESGTMRHMTGCCEALHGSFITGAAGLLDRLDTGHLFEICITYAGPLGIGHETAIYSDATFITSYEGQGVVTLFAVAKSMTYGQPPAAKPDLEITIKGAVASGKSVAMRFISEHLRSLGYLVTTFECPVPGNPCRCAHEGQPAPTGPINRTIHITTQQ